MLKLLIFLFVGIFSLLVDSTTNKPPITLGYFPSWSENFVDVNNLTESYLARTPPSVSHIFLAFAKPNLQYTKGSYNLSSTGIELPYSGSVAKSIFEHLNNQGTKVILSIGGSTYWPNGVPTISYQQIADLVTDFGLAGVDWDFEPDGTFRDIGNAVNVQHYITFINETRKVLPKSNGYLIAVSPAGSGALGGQYTDDTNSPFKFANRNTITGHSDANYYNYYSDLSLFTFGFTGHMIPVFAAIGNEIDIIAYQGYNIGGQPNRYLMYQSYAYYANIYGFSVVAGVHVPNEPWFYFASNALTTARLAQQIWETDGRAGKGDGIMVWELLKTSVIAGETDHSGKSYLNIARNVFNGQSPETAVSNAFVYPTTSNVAYVVPSTTTTSTTTTATPTTTTVSPTPDPSSSSSTDLSVVSPWDPNIVYRTAGSKVTYNNRTYQNKWYTVNERPDISDVWKDITPVDPNVIPDWSSTTTYDGAGYRVRYNNQTYRSNWWTLGNVPGSGGEWTLIS